MLQFLFFAFLLLRGVVAQKAGQQWQTLTGQEPAVIARGGYSGLFPESSEYAYQFALSTSLRSVILFCDLQLAKDGSGFCHTNLRLENSTNIALVYPKGDKTYTVNGEEVHGWFSLDYTTDQLFSNVRLIQNRYSRPSVFDNSLPLLLVDDVSGLRPPKFWINVQYDLFFKQNKIDVTAYILDTAKLMRVNYISSPEIGFLKGLQGKLPKAKLIFRFLNADAMEPSTQQTYGSILKDLKSIKNFASGILVPKTYIWPVSDSKYLQSHTSLVTDAHELGLEVYASGFANDILGSYNYSFDPTAEYLQFIDNSEFSVDGVLTDFPSTASEAIACLAHNNNKNTPTKGKPLIITHNGASGVYAGCSDLAYQKAVDDGADIIDCSVQLSKDGVAFCLDSIDLMGDTTVMTSFMSRSSIIPDIQKESGIFSFDLTWSEIQTLKSEIASPMVDGDLVRNPAYKNQGKLMSLSDFLEFAKDKVVSGILINIQNAAFLASKKGLDIVTAVEATLSKSGYDKQSAQQVMIQSDDSSVLRKFKQTNYKKVLMVSEIVSGTSKPVAEEIKEVADAVNLPRASIVTSKGPFLYSFTDVVDKMYAANISVYISVLRNEFMLIAFDFYADPMVEICTYISIEGVEGIITEFPGTATAYFKSPCFIPGKDATYSIMPVEPGSLLSLAPPDMIPPAGAPDPLLTESDVIDPPLPAVAHASDVSENVPAAVPSSPPSGQSSNTVNVALLLGMLLLSLVSFSYH